MAVTKVKEKVQIHITPPNFKVLQVRVEGVSPIMAHKFSKEEAGKIAARQTGEDATQTKREPKDYVEEFHAARYIAEFKKWDGIPASWFRNSMIRACTLVSGLPMTTAKMCFTVLAQGHDRDNHTPLVRLEKGVISHDTRPVRIGKGGTDLRNRPRYDMWSVELQIKYDADILSAQDVVNLLTRAGAQVGIGEFRPMAPKGFGGDYGLFNVVTSTTQKAKKGVA